MKRSLCRNCILTAATLILPGCLAINAVLGVVGLMGTGPIQYAGTVYSIGEYTYEYAVNDKTPDEVIEDKLAWLMPDNDMPTPNEPELTGYAQAMKNTNIPEATRKLLGDSLQPEKTKSRIMVASAHRQSAPMPSTIVASTRPTRTISTPSAQSRVSPHAPGTSIQAAATAHTRTTLPIHSYIERIPDPLHQKLARLGQTLRQAEQIAEREPVSGVRCSVSSQEAGQPTPGISGSWSIRHSIMQYAPAPGPLAEPLANVAYNSPT